MRNIKLEMGTGIRIIVTQKKILCREREERHQVRTANIRCLADSLFCREPSV
jgi:hypothetical protein